MASFRELLNAAKAEVREVTTEEAAELRSRPGTVVLDVREPDEYEQGAIPGALHIPRGQLESSIEGRISDHDLECAAEALAQREREREPGESAARDHHIGARNCWLVRHRPQRNGTGDTRRSSCKLSPGRKQFSRSEREERRRTQRDGGRQCEQFRCWRSRQR